MATINQFFSIPHPLPSLPGLPCSPQEDDADEHKVNIDVYLMGTPT
jgi:hypothetical protein